MHVQSSILCTVPVTILETIALYTTDALGPPVHLIPLLQTCKHIHACLAFDNNRHLYARTFRCNFDYRAAYRRMGSRAMYSSNLAKQLKIQCVALKRIRRGDIRSEFLVDDLWTAFIMCTENDGKNEVQLEWAGLRSLLDNLIRTRLWEDRDVSGGWPAESTLNALAIWLVWFTLDHDTLYAQSAEQRKELMDLIRPYVLTALRYPSFHAPDNHFEFPLHRDLQNAFPYTLMTPHGFYPLYRQPDQLVEHFRHFNLRLEISAPLIAQGAKLLYMTLFEVTPLPIPSILPVNREHALQLGRTFVSPTQADIIEANAHKSVKLLERGDWDWRSQLSEDDGKLEDDGVWRKGLRGKSALWDNDWHRLTCCADPWNVPELKGVVYTYGTLDGLWQGRLLIPEVNQYFSLVTSTTFPTNFSDQNPRLTTVPVYMRLREHHCINPELPMLPGGAHDGFDEGVRNGWFPSINLHESGGLVRIKDETNGVVTQYETFVEGRANSHSEETCDSCQHQRLEEEEELRERLVEHASEGESTAAGDADSPQSRRLHSSPRSARSPASRASAPDTGSSGPSLSHSVAEEADDAHTIRMQVDAALGPDTDVDELIDAEMGDSVQPDEDESEDDEVSDTCSEESVYEYMMHTCNGIQDIIVTGETLPRHGQAWHHFRFYGRVRKWDGLIAIVRVPVQMPELGVFIFRGYIVANQNFVGSWRAWTINIDAIPLEGPFIMSKV